MHSIEGVVDASPVDRGWILFVDFLEMFFFFGMTHRAECGGMRFWFQMGWVPCIQSRSCRLQCYNPGSFKPSGRSNSHLSTRQSICASRGSLASTLGSLASTLVLGFWAFQVTKKPFDPTVSEVHGGIDNVPVSLLLRMYNISQVSNLVSSCPGCKTQQDWHAPAMSSFPHWGARWRWRWLRGKPTTATFVPTCFAVERGPAGSVLWPLWNSCGSCRSSRRGMRVQAGQLQDLENLLV